MKPENAARRPAPVGRSVNKDWLRALQKAAAVGEEPHRILPLAFDDVACARGDAPALISDQETFSFRQLSARSLRYARWGLTQGLRKGDAIALMMECRAEYVAVWLGLNRIGVAVALINTNLIGEALAHCLRAASPRLLIVSSRYSALCATNAATRLLIHDAEFGQALLSFSDAPLALDESARPSISETALYIYTSGTTGMPKAAIVSHRRVLNWALWFCGLADITPADRMYDCLPLYHSVGGVVAIWATLMGGGAVVLRERFSVNAFWREIVAYDCTLFQYIGELCRYLTHAPACEDEKKHRLRMAIGNGLRPEIWGPFATRFAMPRILEFYAATESNFSLYNVEGEPGAIGRIPAFLAAHQLLRLVKFDAEREAPLRGADGFCQLCDVDEAGEAIARISTRDGSAFEGYLDREASERKILRGAFEPGDAWMRSGDLMRKDARGFYYFVDRVGDTFRWKGENVAADEVAQALASFRGVIDVTVYGVEIPGRDGRAGMAALVVNDDFDLARLRPHLSAQLPPYARPLFLRLAKDLQITDTFKHKKRELALQGFDPCAIGEPVYFASPQSSIYSRMDRALYERILAGAVPL